MAALDFRIVSTGERFVPPSGSVVCLDPTAVEAAAGESVPIENFGDVLRLFFAVAAIDGFFFAEADGWGAKCGSHSADGHGFASQVCNPFCSCLRTQ